MNKQAISAAIAGLCLALVTTGWSDVGPDVLSALAGGDHKAIRQIEDRATLAAQEGNRVAQTIVLEAKIARGLDQDIIRPWVSTDSPTELYEETEKDWVMAVEKKAANGDPFFMDVMGILCFNGYADVPKDHPKAVEWWKKAAGLNGGLAKLRLGNCYLREDVIPPDWPKAAVLYREAGELGIPMAWYNLGGLYKDGKGVPQDFAQAMKHWEKAAQMGLARAQYTLGFYYLEGKEVPRNPELGQQWLRASVAQGYPQARYYLETHAQKETMAASHYFPTNEPTASQ